MNKVCLVLANSKMKMYEKEGVDYLTFPSNNKIGYGLQKECAIRASFSAIPLYDFVVFIDNCSKYSRKFVQEIAKYYKINKNKDKSNTDSRLFDYNTPLLVDGDIVRVNTLWREVWHKIAPMMERYFDTISGIPYDEWLTDGLKHREERQQIASRYHCIDVDTAIKKMITEAYVESRSDFLI